MTSIGYTNPIPGSNVNIYYPYNGDHSKGIPGFIAQAVLDTDHSSNFSKTRYSLRQAWNTTYPTELARQHIGRITTPFRAVYNAGDLLSRQAYSCGGPCQTFQSRPNLRGLKKHFGHIQDMCDGTQIPPAACNQKYVYDSSDYITYKKQSAVVKNYNDVSNGGNRNNAAQQAMRAIRRF